MSTAAVRARPTGLVRGGASVGAATTAASAANYLSNVVLGRGLGPIEFADAALVVSGLLLLSALALGFQLTVARSVAAGGGDRAIARARRTALLTGLVTGGVLAAGAVVLAELLNMSSPWPLAVLAAGVPVYFTMAVSRGVAQATHRFSRLAASLAIEAGTRLAVTFAAVWLGLGAVGAAAALVASFVAASLPCRSLAAGAASDVAASRSGTVIVATVMLLAGQVVISNGDLWVVAAVLPDDAGVYAAVALIGRLVFITAWSVVTVVFPSLVSGETASQASGGSNPLLWRAVGATAVFGAALTAGAAVFGELLITSMVGSAYVDGAALLWPYALATTLFVLANLVAVADVAAGRLAIPGTVAIGGVVQTCTLVVGASAGIAWVVWAQVALMGGLLGAALAVTRARTAWRAIAPARRVIARGAVPAVGRA